MTRQWEANLLGSIFIKPGLLDTVAAGLVADDFETEAFRVAFAAMRSGAARGEPIDSATVTASILANGQREALGGDLAMLGNLARDVVTLANVEALVFQVQADGTRRRFAQRLSEIAGQARQGGDLAELLEATNAATSQVNTRNATPTDNRSELTGLYNDLASGREPEGLILTGLGALDRATGGLYPGLLSIIAGRPGMGKSVFALNVAANAALAGKRVALFSLEESTRFVWLRLAARFSDVALHQLVRRDVPGDAWPRIKQSFGDLAELPLVVVEQAADSGEVRRIARGLQGNGGVDLVLVDHLGFLHDRGRDLFEQTTRAVQGLALLAKEIDVPVMACCQLSRAPEARADHRPMLSDLRQSGEIEQAARLVLMLYRPGYYGERDDTALDVEVAKNSHGMTGTIPLAVNLSRMTVYDPHAANEPDWARA
jgi:replicative DNA helicase